MYLRFVTTGIDEDSHKPCGVFVATYSLLDSGDLGRDERLRIRDLLIWFQKKLPTPPNKFSAGRAIFWFKSSAEEAIKQIWDLVFALRQHGYYVEVHKCRRLGNVVYEDKFQVAAFPSTLDSRVTVQ